MPVVYNLNLEVESEDEQKYSPTSWEILDSRVFKVSFEYFKNMRVILLKRSTYFDSKKLGDV